MIHELKIYPEHFQAIANGRKRFEARSIADRSFDEGDLLHLREWMIDCDGGCYTGREMTARVSLVHAGLGVAPGYVVMSIELANERCEAAGAPSSHPKGELHVQTTPYRPGSKGRCIYLPPCNPWEAAKDPSMVWVKLSNGGRVKCGAGEIMELPTGVDAMIDPDQSDEPGAPSTFHGDIDRLNAAFEGLKLAVAEKVDPLVVRVNRLSDWFGKVIGSEAHVEKARADRAEATVKDLEMRLACYDEAFATDGIEGREATIRQLQERVQELEKKLGTTFEVEGQPITKDLHEQVGIELISGRMQIIGLFMYPDGHGAMTMERVKEGSNA